eukprot:CAMPEP_0196758188 /NCGR_PEP_ID=MMETSP1091-20130531/104055_1 /TAXON_ID=302021 /ORGANISM="Rhodomonas sp., Strain CCMP768" /LENGTH=448 /DNA_ID=CAMNT_0042106997 /DNA_START=9 /DNA_END=1356 /DNA_ORIENTATION=-
MARTAAGIGLAAAAGLGLACALLMVATSWWSPRSQPADLLQYPYGQPGWRRLPIPFAFRQQALVHQPRNGQVAEVRVPQFAALQGQPNVFVGRMLCAEGETSCEHPCSAFHTISETDTQPNVFVGRMLCAEGETSCEHPCSAFHTISETDTDCHCKCTVNPLSFAKDDVICTCPDAPIDPANDQYPWPEGEGWEVPEEEEEVPAVPEEDEANPEAEEAVDTTAPTAPVDEETTGENTPTTTTTTTQTRARGAMALAALRARRARMQLALQQQHQQQAYPYVQFDSFAPPSFLPPDGDYPGGSTGIPMDGYIGFDTGHGQQPYHGTYAPMQESGIADGRKRGGSALRQGRAGGSEEEEEQSCPRGRREDLTLYSEQRRDLCRSCSRLHCHASGMPSGDEGAQTEPVLNDEEQMRVHDVACIRDSMGEESPRLARGFQASHEAYLKRHNP